MIDTETLQLPLGGVGYSAPPMIDRNWYNQLGSRYLKSCYTNRYYLLSPFRISYPAGYPSPQHGQIVVPPIPISVEQAGNWRQADEANGNGFAHRYLHAPFMDHFLDQQSSRQRRRSTRYYFLGAGNVCAGISLSSIVSKF